MFSQKIICIFLEIKIGKKKYSFISQKGKLSLTDTSNNNSVNMQDNETGNKHDGRLNVKKIF